MSRIEDLANALRHGKEYFEVVMGSEAPEFITTEHYDLRGSEAPASPAEDGRQLRLSSFQPESSGSGPADCGRIAIGDNLDYMLRLLKHDHMAGKIQMIYVDPPFFSNASYQASVQIESEKLGRSPVLKAGAFDDKWGGDLEAYLEMLAVRFMLMRELLADTGCLWVHLDWHGSHYVKMMLDEIFGEDRFVNEVIWTYKSGGSSRRAFAKKHDSLLFYSKSAYYKFRPQKEKSYNRDRKPYRFKGVEEFQDEGGWYTMVNMKDVWNIDMVGRTSHERMGYATQKPEKLLRRVVECCTDPGDLCADFFAGTGTLGAACADLGRRWIMCDEGRVSAADMVLRMARGKDPFIVQRQADPAQDSPDPQDSGGSTSRAPYPGLEDWPGRGPEAELVREGDSLYIRSYWPDMDLVRPEDQETVSKYLVDDSLNLIRFWSVDCKLRDETADAQDGTGDETAGPEDAADAGGDTAPDAGAEALDGGFAGAEEPDDEAAEPADDPDIHHGRKLLAGNDIYMLRPGYRGPVSIIGYDIFGGRFLWDGRI